MRIDLIVMRNVRRHFVIALPGSHAATLPGEDVTAPKPSDAASTFSTAGSTIAPCVTSVADPTCGDTTRFGASNNGSPGSQRGSLPATSPREVFTGSPSAS